MGEFKKDLLSIEELVQQGYSEEEAKRIKEEGSGPGSARKIERWLAMGYSKKCAKRLKRSRIPGTLEYFCIYKNYDPFEARHEVREYNQNKAVDLEGYIEKWGEKEGKRRWKEYKEKQAYTNSYEYKKEKYGWTKEEFEEYNKSRAVTLENMIEKYGKEEGKKVYENYVDKQKRRGVKLSWFKEKYGEEKGEEKYEKVNKLKSHTFESYLERFDGDEEKATKKLNEFWEVAGPSSEIANDFFSDLRRVCVANSLGNIYFDSYNHEYIINSSERRFLLDFYCKDVKKGIEFYGDYWHGNPDIYNKNDTISLSERDIRVGDKHKEDQKRINKILSCSSHVDDILVVWEKDVRENRKSQINKCIKFLRGDNL